MPVKYIGRVTDYAGKPLWRILYNLKNFGVGRIVYRNMFQRYPEPSYYIITQIDQNPECKTEGSKIKISGQKIFRGKDVGEMAIDADHKRDWRLVPRHEEQMFLSAKTATREPVVIKDTTPFPPLLERMIRRDLKAAGKECSEPLELKLDIRQHRLNHAILESELRT